MPIRERSLIVISAEPRASVAVGEVGTLDPTIAPGTPGIVSQALPGAMRGLIDFLRALAVDPHNSHIELCVYAC